MPPGSAILRLYITRNLSRNANSDLAFAHLRKIHDAIPAIRFVVVMFIPFSNFVDGAAKIAVPLQGVHREVQMRIKNKHCLTSFSVGFDIFRKVVCGAFPGSSSLPLSI